MKKLLQMILGASLVLSLVGCTANERARSFGGTETMRLERGIKLENVTWKESEIWILTRPMRSDERAETHEFIEKSRHGLVEGKVIIIETR